MKYHELVEEVAKFDTKAANYMLTREDLFLTNPGDLDEAFIWANTPQGHDYWSNIYHRMVK